MASKKFTKIEILGENGLRGCPMIRRQIGLWRAVHAIKRAFAEAGHSSITRFDDIVGAAGLAESDLPTLLLRAPVNGVKNGRHHHAHCGAGDGEATLGTADQGGNRQEKAALGQSPGFTLKPSLTCAT